MFCRNCGGEMPTDAPVCRQCGVPAGMGNHYCPACGIPSNELAVLCVRCGISFLPAISDRSKMVAGLLGIFLGSFGVHNFYLGHYGKAIIQLFLFIIGMAGYIIFFFTFMITMQDHIYMNKSSVIPAIYNGPSAVGITFLLASIGIIIGVRIWTVVESVFIFTGKIKDAKGLPLK